MKDPIAVAKESNVLRLMFDEVCAMPELTSEISDSKIMRQTASRLKVALRGVKSRCTCIKRSYDMCESCMEIQGCDLIDLRAFYNTVRRAKKFNMPSNDLQDYVASFKQRLNR